jgi:hypothetical protein
MTEERRNAGCAIQMASASSPGLHTVDLTSPFAEDTIAENTIRELALEVQETELRFFKPL